MRKILILIHKSKFKFHKNEGGRGPVDSDLILQENLMTNNTAFFIIQIPASFCLWEGTMVTNLMRFFYIRLRIKL